MLINGTCIRCQMDKHLKACPGSASAEERALYEERLQKAAAESALLSAPELSGRMDAIQKELFGPPADFSEIKRHFNQLMLGLMPRMEEKLKKAEDPLKMALQLAMMGNYTDFAALEQVSEETLRQSLDRAREVALDEALKRRLQKDVLLAKRLVYFTDNCGEIACDKLLISVLRGLNPELEVTAIVRGSPVVNDATLEDAKQVGLGDVCQRVIGNGSGLAGAAPGAMSSEALSHMREADVVIAKGQGNFEGLSGCGLNVYYLFMCKCELFTRRFGVPRLTGIMTHEGQEAP